MLTPAKVKRAKIAEKTRCQACLSLLTDGNALLTLSLCTAGSFARPATADDKKAHPPRVGEGYRSLFPFWRVFFFIKIRAQLPLDGVINRSGQSVARLDVRSVG